MFNVVASGDFLQADGPAASRLNGRVAHLAIALGAVSVSDRKQGAISGKR
jgi:hypothetical protein